MFVDEHDVEVFAGRGGDGCVSFRREKFVPKGGPDGGDGGRGGDVIFEACPHTDGLANLRFVRELKARNGGKGAGSNCHGRNAEDLVVRVPIGTLVYELVSQEAEAEPEVDEENPLAAAPESAFTEEGASGEDAPEASRSLTPRLIADLTEVGQQFVVAKGGKGGFGNKRFATATNQRPKEFTPGRDGQHRQIRLEVKLIADVGLVGLPNAGKSTLLSRCTKAHPKIAAYPFTTLTPYLGIVDLDRETRFIMADIPGLIEGASGGKGLGHRFLRHVERTRVLLHMVDLSAGDAEQLKHDHDVIVHELAAFSETLAAKPRILVGNKADIPGAHEMAKELAGLLDEPVHVISGVTGEGLKELLWLVYRRVQEARGSAENVHFDPTGR